MQFSATLRTDCYVHSRWREEGRIGGTYLGAHFDFTDGKYVAAVIPENVLDRLAANPFVAIDVVTEPVGLPATATLPPPDTDTEDHLSEPSVEPAPPERPRRGRPRTRE